ncbi:MAG TPA: PA14 domain-containing protein [Fimbriimonadaceae bacterium]|jgi:hypothetical protein
MLANNQFPSLRLVNVKQHFVAFVLACLTAAASAQTAVTTWHNDNNRVGLNPNERILTPSNVNAASFGLLFDDSVDGEIFAQPLYVPGVTINGTVHNVVYVATENNSVYAFDADQAGLPLWSVNLDPGIPASDIFPPYFDVGPVVGITGTPVIDETNGKGIIYLVSKAGNNVSCGQDLHALDITTGSEAITPPGATSPGPVNIASTVNGTGDGSDGNGNVPFNPLWQAQRPALLLIPGPNANAPKTLVIAWASHGDAYPYHGWLMAYNASTLAQEGVFNTTPNATSDPNGGLAAGGIWMSGAGPASDGTSLYFATGNGAFDPSTAAWGDSILRMTLPFAVADSFTPNAQLSLDDTDTDQGSGGVMLLPPSVGSKAHPKLLVQEGKSGTIYLCDVTDLGGYNSTDAVAQEVDNANRGVWGAMAYFNGHIYVGGSNGSLQSFGISSGAISTPAIASSANKFNIFGTTPSVSSNGTANGIVWAIDTASYTSDGQEYLYAYDASTLKMLYRSPNVQGPSVYGPAVKFVTPTVANGKVYAAANGTLGVYGLATALPTSNVASGKFSSSFQVTLSDLTAGARIYYTLDGTVPNTYSNRYSGPITISSNATLVLRAVFGNYKPSATNYYYYSFPPLVSAGTGLTGKYFNGTQTPSGTPTLARLDPTINFNWGSGSPASGVASTNWSAEWTGYITPQFSGPYNLYVENYGGVRLWLNGREVINGWIDIFANYSSGRYDLVAGHKYPIKIDFFVDQQGSLLQLSWQTLGTQLVIVPKTQLSPN